MPRTYIPKTSYFAPTRIEKEAKSLLSEYAADKAKALEAFDCFRQMVETNPDDDRAKGEMLNALSLSIQSNDKQLKVLEAMIRMRRDILQKSKTPGSVSEEVSFDSIKDLVFGSDNEKKQK